MHTLPDVTLDTVRDVYTGPEGDLWELVMGEQIHVGGLASSAQLAKRAALEPGFRGVDLCCCNGAGMRFLLRFAGAASMVGVDATDKMLDRARRRCEAEQCGGRVEFVRADVTDIPLDDGTFDFVWGEDAWCYVVDKPALIAEAARLARPGGTIAFTDWVTGPSAMTDAEAERLLRFMKFPSIVSLDEYADMLRGRDCEVLVSEDTGRFAAHVDLYINMLTMQLTYDALKIINFDQDLMAGLAGEMSFLQDLAHAGKLIQGMTVARKND